MTEGTSKMTIYTLNRNSRPKNCLREKIYAITAPSIILRNAPTNATKILLSMGRQMLLNASVKLSLIAEKEIAKEKIFAAIAECGFKLFRIVTYSGTKLKTMESVTHVTTKICTPRRSDC